MKLDKFIYIAILVSILLHVIFFASSPFIVLPGISDMYDNTRKIFRLQDVDEKAANVNLFKEDSEAAESVKVSNEETSIEKDSFENMILEEQPLEDFSFESKKDELKQAGIDNLPLEHDKDIVSDFMRKKDMESYAEGDRRDVSETGFDGSRVSYEVVSTKRNYAEGQAVKTSYVKPIVEEEGTGFLRSDYEADDLMKKQEITKSSGRLGDYEDVTEKLKVNVVTYQDKLSGENFFKITVSVKDGEHFKVMPKEVIFLIDSSKSVTESKLDLIKESIIDSLPGHNPSDRVNVVAFRGDTIKFKNESVPITDRVINKIKSFISKLQAVGQTDVEKALLGIISEKIMMYPSYIVLITDGRPTAGILDSKSIIQEITRKNNMKRPIFCFGGGRKVNKYLLDFISFQNRGWSQFSETTGDILEQFKAFYGQIKDPILVDVRYRISGLDEEGVYPKYLSDFYHGRTFVIYGKYNSEDIFSMQILGQINGQIKEFIFQRSLKNAPKGTAEIAREWAFMKVYHLISRNTMGLGEKELQDREIVNLSNKFNIKTPYDIVSEKDLYD